MCEYVYDRERRAKQHVLKLSKADHANASEIENVKKFEVKQRKKVS